MTPPRVSVVMCVYNAMPFLDLAVESILQQTWSDLELIAVDDGSVDESWDRLVDFANRDSRIILLRNTENEGFARSSNTVLRRALGDFVALQDADDLSTPTRLHEQVKFLSEHPDVGVVGTWPQFIDVHGAVIEDSGFLELADPKDLQENMPFTYCFCSGTSMIRRPLLEQVGGYDPEMEWGEDTDLELRLSEVTQLANLPRRLYLYRQHAASTSTRHRCAQMYLRALAVERSFSRRCGQGVPESLAGRLAEKYLKTALLAEGEGDRDLAARSATAAFRMAPGIARRGRIVEKVFERYLSMYPPEDPFATVARVFRDLLPDTLHLARSRQHLLADPHVAAAFRARAAGDRSGVAAHLLSGVRGRPTWLFNRGVWSLGLQALGLPFGRRSRWITPEAAVGARGEGQSPRASDRANS